MLKRGFPGLLRDHPSGAYLPIMRIIPTVLMEFS
jgi:hypothetical protein